MPVGLEVFNESGQLLISSESTDARVVKYGTSNLIELSDAELAQAPLIFLRPRSPNQIFGAFRNGDPGSSPLPTGARLRFDGAADWAIVNPFAAPISRGQPFGIEVFDGAGNVTFSSNFSYSRLRTLYRRPSFSGGQGYPTVVSALWADAMPWVMANDLIETGRGIGEFSESVGAIYASISADFKTITYTFRDSVTGNIFPNLADRGNYDPWVGRARDLWIAEIPGL